MTEFELAACLVVLAALLSYLNYRLLRLPTAVGTMALTLAASLLLVLVGLVVPGLDQQARALVARIDLQQAVLHGMLGFLLFAGSLQIDLGELVARKGPVTVLSTLGVVLSTALVGLFTWAMLHGVGIPARPIYCLLFGALISPTDPIAVMAILRQAGVPQCDLEITIAGESLFNDGVGVVVLRRAAGRWPPGQVGLRPRRTWSVCFCGRRSAGPPSASVWGGSSTGCSSRWTTIRSRSYCRCVLVAGGYAALTNALHMSGLIAMVVAGLLDWQPGPDVRHVPDHGGEPGHVLGADRRGAQRRPVRPDRWSGTGPNRDRALPPDRAFPSILVVLLARLAAVAGPVVVLSRWCGFTRADHPGLNLGRITRRHLGRPGPGRSPVHVEGARWSLSERTPDSPTSWWCSPSWSRA